MKLHNISNAKVKKHHEPLICLGGFIIGEKWDQNQVCRWCQDGCPSSLASWTSKAAAEQFFILKFGFRGGKLTGLMSWFQKCKNLSIFVSFYVIQEAKTAKTGQYLENSNFLRFLPLVTQKHKNMEIVLHFWNQLIKLVYLKPLNPNQRGDPLDYYDADEPGGTSPNELKFCMVSYNMCDNMYWNGKMCSRI